MPSPQLYASSIAKTVPQSRASGHNLHILNLEFHKSVYYFNDFLFVAFEYLDCYTILFSHFSLKGGGRFFFFYY